MSALGRLASSYYTPTEPVDEFLADRVCGWCDWHGEADVYRMAGRDYTEWDCDGCFGHHEDDSE